jgi:site-specific DNA-methyltransferase (adenine-specific)
MAGCPAGGVVLDPFFGAGTVGVMAYKLDRKFLGIELSKEYCDEISIPRIEKETRQLKLWA